MNFLSGGGIGGLAFGVALAKVPGIEVHIYEAANAFTDIGAGIGTWSRGWEVLKKLGLGQELGSLAEPVAAKEGPSESPSFREIGCPLIYCHSPTIRSPCISFSEVRSSRGRKTIRLARLRYV